MALVYVFIILLSVLAAALYGIAHNQISYTVSPEYFTKFKFQEFGLNDVSIPERVRASMVGFFASWWMGIPLGLLVGAAGFLQQNAAQMLRASLWSIAVVLAFTLTVGLCGLCYGWLETASINRADYSNWYVPDTVINLRRYLCAGYMHNASYLGGTLAILPAWIFQLWFSARRSKASPSTD
jgi:hypothetical protein